MLCRQRLRPPSCADQRTFHMLPSRGHGSSTIDSVIRCNSTTFALQEDEWRLRDLHSACLKSARQALVTLHLDAATGQTRRFSQGASKVRVEASRLFHRHQLALLAQARSSIENFHCEAIAGCPVTDDTLTSATPR
jgi:hypothetical protein